MTGESVEAKPERPLAPFGWNLVGVTLREALRGLQDDDGLSDEASRLAEDQLELSMQAAVSQAVAADFAAQEQTAEALLGERPRKRRRERKGTMREAPAGHRVKLQPAANLQAQVKTFKILNGDIAFELKDVRLTTHHCGIYHCEEAGLIAANPHKNKQDISHGLGLWTPVKMHNAGSKTNQTGLVESKNIASASCLSSNNKETKTREDNIHNSDRNSNNKNLTNHKDDTDAGGPYNSRDDNPVSPSSASSPESSPGSLRGVFVDSE